MSDAKEPRDQWFHVASMWPPKDAKSSVAASGPGSVPVPFIVPTNARFLVRRIPKDKQKEKGPAFDLFVVIPAVDGSGGGGSGTGGDDVPF